jgi:hypothetical protein
MIANLEGDWYFTEVPVNKDFAPILAIGGKITIKATKAGNFYVKAPLNVASIDPTFIELDEVPCELDDKLRPTLSGICTDPNNSSVEYGLRLVFDLVDVSLKIVEGALGSIVERWVPESGITPAQPSDMGVITGSKA